MRPFPRQLAAFAFAVGFVLPSLAFATNGYFAIGYGIKNRGMAGVAVADPKDALATTANPAGMAFVGTRLDIGARLFIPKRQSAAKGELGLSADADTTGDSGATVFMVPNMGANAALGKWSVGFAMVGNGGMSTRYNTNFFSLGGGGKNTSLDQALGVSLMQVLILPTITYKVTPTQAFGIAPILGIQVFRAYGLGKFDTSLFSAVPGRVTNNGNDWSYGAGARVGWMGKFLDGRLALGVTYATRVYMSPLTKYKGLFADGGDFDIPRNFAVGIAVKPIRRLTVGLDVQRVFYREVHSVGDRHPAGSGGPAGLIAPPGQKLGATAGMGFGWRDQTAYKLGVSYELNDRWTVRGGFDYGRSPVPTDQLLFNVLAPGIVTRHWTGGFTYNLSPASEVSGSFMFAPRTTQICAYPACQTMLTYKQGDFIGAQMWQYSLGISYGLKF
jgi:long-chain fatty acid transport protein